MSKVYKENDLTQPTFPKNYKVLKRWEGVCTELVKNSNKYFHLEAQSASNGQARIFTTYGRVGKTAAKEYRYYQSEDDCLRDYEKLIRKKRDRKKDPYREVDLAITTVGSAGAQEIKKPMIGIDVSKSSNSSLHPKVEQLVSQWFGSTGQFITMTLKCPLGQLSKEQIDKGRAVLNDCKFHVNSKTGITDSIYDKLTSQFYSLIPHVLPHRIDPKALRLNTIDRIMEKHDVLDTFLDAKNVESVMSAGSSIEKQYKTLNVELDWVDPKSELYVWLNNMVHKTRSSGHAYLGKIKIHNIFKINRRGEDELFCSKAEKIAGDRKTNGWTWPSVLKGIGDRRPDVAGERLKLYKKANILPLFHGTRNENMLGITTKGLLIRPSGAVHTGSMYGSGVYKTSNSSKSLGYSSCKGTYWARGNNKVGYIFLMDGILGDPKIVSAPYYYTATNIKPFHSVWAKAGVHLLNDEMISYYPAGVNQQYALRYIFEIETQAR